ncbi:major capsid protein P2 [Enterovibrio norvegicus]|uniref:major capsid protein P2 n=1 Tax=Enterovibrio norvegicus TaxID=188144 RepID=UPI0024B0469E|nr:major capsid protein P2 [Enterovibrio norvegicus]
MTVKPIKLNSMVGAQWGQKGTLPIPTGPTYHELILDTNAKAIDMARITVTLNAEEIYVLDGPELLMLERYKRNDHTANHYVIPFSDIVARTKNGVRYTGLVTELGDNIHLDIEFNPKSGANVTPLSIQVHAWVSNAQAMRVLVPMMKRETMPANAAGVNEFTSLVSSPLISVRRLHFMHDAITKLEIERDFVKEYEATRFINDANAKRNGRTPQAGYFHYDPIVRGFSIDELFPTQHSSSLKFSVTTDDIPGSIPILVESVKVVRPELLKGRQA